MNQVLEFYPSSHWCIQWCFHCLRGIKELPNSTVTEITDRQRELTRNILFCFWDEVESQNTLNLSWYIGEYGFKLFDDIWWFWLDQVYFNLWLLDQNSLSFVKDNVEKVWNILPTNSSNRDIDIFWNIQHVDWWKQLQDTQLLRDFTDSFFQALKLWVPFSSKIFTWLMIVSNNISERNRRELNELELLNSFVGAHWVLWDDSISAASFRKFSDEWISFVRSDKVINGKHTRIDFRWICAKKSKKTTFLEELGVSLWQEELTISVFPDTVMVYHSTLNMHVKELFFSYDEFEQILKDYVCQIGSERYTFKRIIDDRLTERACVLWLI